MEMFSILFELVATWGDFCIKTLQTAHLKDNTSSYAPSMMLIIKLSAFIKGMRISVPKLVNDLASSSASMGGCLRVQIQATKL
jgi:hypothetical protein